MVENNALYDEDEVVKEDEVLPEDIELDAEEEEKSINEKLRALREKLSACEEEKKQHLEDLGRARADFLNSKRRLLEQLELDKARATDKILSEIITLVDSFDTAMLDTALWETIDPKWRSGVEAIHTKLLAMLKSNSILPVDPGGAPFNPEEHEAVANAQVEDDTQVDTIVTVLQKGYKRNDTVIRPAKVVVGTKQ